MSRSWNTELLARDGLDHALGFCFQLGGVQVADAVEREVALCDVLLEADRRTGRPEMDRRREANAAIGVRAVVDRDVVPGAREVTVGDLRPCRAPGEQISLVARPLPV